MKSSTLSIAFSVTHVIKFDEPLATVLTLFFHLIDYKPDPIIHKDFLLKTKVNGSELEKKVGVVPVA